jgi:hypothetical protein
MSKPAFDLQAITERLSQIPRERERLQDRLSSLAQEENDLKTALRVVQRFGGPSIDAAVGGEGGKANKLGPPRPEGTPTLYEMTMAVINEAIAKGKPGLRNREIVDEIGAKYWPGVQPEQILAPIYSFVKKKRLRKGADGVFKPPLTN